MILRTRNGQNREYRSFGEFGSSYIPPPGSGFSAFAGVPVTEDRTFGLPAVMDAIRLIAELTATMDIGTYRGFYGEKTTAEDSWQDKLLDQPNQDQSQFDWLSDISACVEGFGNAFVEKVKFRGEVVELIPRDPNFVRVKREGNQKLFDVTVDGRTRSNLTAAQILHVRGFSVRGFLSGFSPITMHRQALGTAIALEEFQGRYFANDTTPSGAIEMPGQTTKTRALEILDLWKATHGGVQNAGKPAILSGGATWKQIGVNLVDAQFVEAQKFTVEQVARIFRVPSDLIGGVVDRGVAATAEQVGLRFLVFSLLPRLRRIELALAADLDLFANTDVYPKFTTDDLLRADALTKAQVQHYQIQDGTLLVDEARAEDGRGPLPPIPKDPSLTPGMVPQITPVGGAPNAPLPAPTNANANGASQAMRALEIHNHVPAANTPDVYVTTPEVRVETPVFVEPAAVHTHVAPAAVSVATPEVRVDSPITVEAARPAEVRVPVTVQPANAPDVHVSPAEVRVDAPITVEAGRAPDVRVETPVTVEAAKAPDVHIDSPITVEQPDIHVAPAEVRVPVTVEAAKAPNVNVEAAQIRVQPKVVLEVPKRTLKVKRQDGTETTFTEED